LPQQQRIQSETERQMIEPPWPLRGAAWPVHAEPPQGWAFRARHFDSKIAALGIDKHRYKTR